MPKNTPQPSQTVTRPQTPRGGTYVPNPPRAESYTGTVKSTPARRPRSSN